jgi:predicted dinucleotide-binding enzyme
MKIGVIGIGEMGGTIARKWREKGHLVRVANSRGAGAVKHFADDIGADAADIYGAVDGADVVLLSIPFPAVAKLPRDLFDRAAAGVVIIDTGNYYPDVRDPRIPEIDAGMPESVWISQRLDRPIVKAFNSILSHSLAELGKPEGSPGRLAIPVAASDARAKQIAMGLVNDAGFDPVDGGSLEASWRQQPSTPAYCCDYGAAKTREGMGAAVRGKAEKLRDTEWRLRYFNIYASKPTHADAHDDVIAMNRSLNPLQDTNQPGEKT